MNEFSRQRRFNVLTALMGMDWVLKGCQYPGAIASEHDLLLMEDPGF